ncbi:MAG: hypothetical protein ACUVSQ_01080 [Pseudanabaenaceae cyanobacterium]
MSEVHSDTISHPVPAVETAEAPEQTAISPSHQICRLTAELEAAHRELWRQQQWIGHLEEQVAILQSRLETLHVGNREAYIAELQEQVLQQASQAAEREAAIQYWKEQSLQHQRHALQLRAALDRLLAEQEHRTETPHPLPKAAPPPPTGANPKPSIALPGFLGRRSLVTEA